MNKFLVNLIASIMVMVGVTGSVYAAEESELPISIPKAKRSAVAGEWKCVEDTDVMRKNHMKFILHQRDETMHKGIRGTKYSLAGCIECHSQSDSQGKAIPINSEGQFCESCHHYAAVNIDCFSCHRTTPLETKGQDSAQLNNWNSLTPLAESDGLR